MLSGTIGRYRILRPLGQGGMGEVYLAEDTTLGRRVAIKTLPEARQQDAVARERLLREARAAAGLNQPNICTIHEVGEHAGLSFVVMEFVDGETLRDTLSHRRFDRSDALRIMTEVADALDEAHRAGIVHRDLKPANIMRTRTGSAKVMDFGLARQIASDGSVSGETATEAVLTAEGTTVGTLTYMSPEQLRGGRADVRSDLFAFGIVLYQVLTGEHPFARPSPMETAAAILNSPAPRLSETAPDSPPLLDHIVAKLLAKAPEDRYQSAHDLRTDLASIAGDSSAGAVAAARPMSTVTAASPPVQRARRGWLIAAVAAVVGIALVLPGVWMFSGATPARALAFAERDWIVISDFDNQTGEPVFDRSLDAALAVSVQQSKYVNLFPRTRVQQTLALMQKAGAPVLNDQLAREVAVRAGLRALIVPRIARVADEYVLTAEIVDAETQVTVASSSARAAGQSAVLGALDDLSRQTRAKLGESLASIADQRVLLPLATTTSLEALKAFAESRRPKAPAETLLLRAIELDPDFAMAHADLGLLYYITDERTKGEAHFAKALSLVDRLTLRERLWVNAVVEDWRGNRDAGIERYNAYVSQYPDDGGAWFRLGYAYMLTNQAALAIDPFSKSLALDPSRAAAALSNIASCYNLLRQDDKAYEAYQRAFASDPGLKIGNYVNGEYGFLLARMGRLDDAAKVFELMIADAAADKKARGHRSRAQLAVFRGRYAEAAAALTEAARINKTGRFDLSELRDRTMLEDVLRTRGQRRAAAVELDAIQRLLDSFKPGVIFLARAGAAFARHGRLEDSERILKLASARLGDLLVSAGINNTRSDRAAIEELKGEIQLARRRPDLAIGFFEESERLNANAAVHLLAEAAFEHGDLDTAARHYRKAIAVNFIGQELTGPTVIAHYQLARVLERQQNRAAAAAEYTAFLTLWKDGDADLPLIVDAKQRLARLNAGALPPR